MLHGRTPKCDVSRVPSSRSKKPCKYFDQGRGTCPFGGKCFYMHAYPDGTRAEPDKPRKQLGSEGNVRVRGRHMSLDEDFEKRQGRPARSNAASVLQNSPAREC